MQTEFEKPGLADFSSSYLPEAFFFLYSGKFGSISVCLTNLS